MTNMKKLFTFLLALALILIYKKIDAQDIVLYELASFYTDVFDEGAAETVAHDPNTQRVFFTNSDANSVTILDITDPFVPIEVTSISMETYGGGVNSVDVHNGLVAVAVEANNSNANGKIVFLDTDGNFQGSVGVGVLPDMVIFTNDGSKVLSANEGEPNDEYTIDPEGSISIIDISNGIPAASVTTVGFGSFSDIDALRFSGIRIFGPRATPAQDLEPEYIAISDDDLTAYVICQENNALVIVDIESGTVSSILPLGTKDHSIVGNGFDASNRDDTINITTHPVLGFYMPDAIIYKEIGGNGYLLTANEGDARDYDGFSEEVRVKDLVLDPTSYPNADSLQADEALGRLKTTTVNGDTDGDGDIDQIYSYGARSFSIWDASTGELVFDSGDQFEQILAQLNPRFFNSTNDENEFDNRSDDKGPEPEAITAFDLDGKTYAIIGLEREGGTMIFDITDPNQPQYVNYLNNRDYFEFEESRVIGDLGVEDIVFIEASDSPTGAPLVITANEVSGTVTFFSVNDPLIDIIFDETIDISEFIPTEITMPPSPLSTQVVFIGGHDIVQTTATYGNPAGQAIAKEWHDFIGFTPDDSGESMGWVTVNHEQIYRDDRIGDGGGMTAFRINKNADGQVVVMDQSLEDGRQGHFFNVDFVNTVGETGMNCGGINSPDGRIWTAEEWFRDETSDIYSGVFRGQDRPNSWNPHNPAPMSAGYGVRDTSEFTISAPEFPMVDGMTIQKFENFNYMTEVDPKQAVAIRKQYNWGRAGWEGGAISNDGTYVYLGIDGVPAPWVRFTAETPFDFTKGKVEVFKHDNARGERWIEVPESVENIFGGLTSYAWSVGATMYMRNEWVTIDPETGVVYWTETGRDSGSSGPGIVFGAVSEATSAVIAPHHERLAYERGHESAVDPAYQDYYGRVLSYDPATEEVDVVVEGGPFFSQSPAEEDYPTIHLSNPDGLSIMKIDGRSFLMIQEDLNGSSFGRAPEGISNRLCELFLLDVRKRTASVDDLIRVSAIPAGAEITGAIQIDDNTILVNSQHPNADNPFPYNHSLTVAIHGFADISLDELKGNTEKAQGAEGLIVNQITREIKLPIKSDVAIYDSEGKRVKVIRKTDTVRMDNLERGDYYVRNAQDKVFKFTLQ